MAEESSRARVTSLASNPGETARQEAVGRRPMPDSFDNPPKIRRVGAHRAPKRKGLIWVRVLWIALATVALTAAGIIFVVIGPENLLFPQASTSSQEATSEEEQELRGVTNPATTVTVLNGTTTPGLGEEVSAIITEGEFGTVAFVGNAEDRTATISAVFYSNPEDEALAKGLGEELGGIFYYLREDYVTFGTQLVVLIGSDYQSTSGSSGSNGSSSSPSPSTGDTNSVE